MMSVPAYERLTALDASFLHAEGETTPMHVGALSVFEGAPFFDRDGAFRLTDVRRRVESRLHLVPRLRRKLRLPPLGIGQPVWVDADDFDIADHVKLMVLPPPGDRAVLEHACERLQMQLLDRNRPLWELWFIGGLHDGNVAMVEKLHHALVDGVSGVEVAAALLDLEPVPPPDEGSSDPVAPWSPAPAPDARRLVTDALTDRFGTPVAIARSAFDAARVPLLALRRTGAVLDAARSLVGPEGRAPASSLNRATVGEHRRLVRVDVPLDDLRDVGHAFAVTLNDVVLAGVTGALRRLLESRGEPVDDGALHALVPVSIRVDAEHLALGNRVSAMIAPLPVGEDAPLTRLLQVHHEMAERKAHHQAEGNELLLETAELLPATVSALVARQVHHQPFVNVVVTNIPGPSCPLWFFGARMLEATPIVPLGGNLTIGIALLSYDGTLAVGLHADADAAPDLPVLADALAAEFAALHALVRPGDGMSHGVVGAGDDASDSAHAADAADAAEDDGHDGHDPSQVDAVR
jgi:diacylglycerol O-acyltransferase / wax synthase